jgi:DNA-binding CsgD family transcriptional regulator
MDCRDNGEEVLRSRAVQADATEGRQIDLALVWRALVNGDSRATDSFHSADRCYLLLEPPGHDHEKCSKTQAAKIRILEAILLEGAQKNVAIDLGLSPSTVAGALKQCLEAIGLPCTTSRISSLLVGAAYASQADSQRRWGRVSEVLVAGVCYRVISVARPEAELARLLTPAQYEVVRLLIEGKSHVEIAISRHRSTRTIANQLGAVFRKLGVSGRSELIRSLIAQSPEAARSAPAAATRKPAAWLSEPPLAVRRYRPRARRAGAEGSLVAPRSA